MLESFQGFLINKVTTNFQSTPQAPASEHSKTTKRQILFMKLLFFRKLKETQGKS